RRQAVVVFVDIDRAAHAPARGQDVGGRGEDVVFRDQVLHGRLQVREARLVLARARADAAAPAFAGEPAPLCAGVVAGIAQVAEVRVRVVVDARIEQDALAADRQVRLYAGADLADGDGT